MTHVKVGDKVKFRYTGGYATGEIYEIDNNHIKLTLSKSIDGSFIIGIFIWQITEIV